jgi:hypothetical protein
MVHFEATVTRLTTTELAAQLTLASGSRQQRQPGCEIDIVRLGGEMNRDESHGACASSKRALGGCALPGKGLETMVQASFGNTPRFIGGCRALRSARGLRAQSFRAQFCARKNSAIGMPYMRVGKWTATLWRRRCGSRSFECSGYD